MADTIPFKPKEEKNKEDATGTERSFYSSDEVADIIRLSLQKHASDASGMVDYAELLSIGEEMGVNAEQIDQSIKLLAEEQRTKAKEDELWKKFKAHCFISTSTIILCILINLLTGISNFWAGYPLVSLGFFMLGHYAGLRYAPEFVQLATQRTMELAISKTQEALNSNTNANANVTFSISDDLGLSETSGMLYIEDNHLVIEHQNLDSILGIWKSRIKETEIPISEIKSAHLEQKFWNSELVLQASTMKTFRHLPGEVAGTVRITLNKQSYNAANALVKEISSLQKESA